MTVDPPNPAPPAERCVTCGQPIDRIVTRGASTTFAMARHVNDCADCAEDWEMWRRG